jgi:hypothetical protein
MMLSPIELMVDAVCKCVQCGTPMKQGCRCFELERELVDEAAAAIAETRSYKALLNRLDEIVRRHKGKI